MSQTIKPKRHEPPAPAADDAAAIIGLPPAEAPPLTAWEEGYLQQVEVLERALAEAQRRARRAAYVIPRDADDDDTHEADLACPYCLSRDVKYSEPVTNWREPEGASLTDGTLTIDSSDDTGENDGSNAYVYCTDCNKESALPAGFDIEWS